MTCREFIMHAAHMCMCCCRVLCAEENRRSSRQVRGSIQRVAWRGGARSLSTLDVDAPRARSPYADPSRLAIPIAYRPSAAAFDTCATSFGVASRAVTREPRECRDRPVGPQAQPHAGRWSLQLRRKREIRYSNETKQTITHIY